jgi:hypothetical protein
MTTQSAAQTPEGNRQGEVLKRRGLFAAAAALVAAVVAKVTEQKVEAGVDGDVVLGASNFTTGTTVITATNSDGTGFIGDCSTGIFSWGLQGVGNQYGVLGVSSSAQPGASAGVRGIADSANGYGVWGTNSVGGGRCPR